MIVTERDKRVIKFIEDNKTATTNTIADIFYPCLRVAQHRLKLLTENKVLKRHRDNYTSQYYYYIRKPKQVRHSLLVTDFYNELNKIAKIELFKTEFTIEDIRADAFIAYEINNKKRIAFLEVQISNAPLDVEKYEKLYKSRKYKNYFPAFPVIIAVTNKNIPKTNLKVIKVNENIENLRGIMI